LLTGQPPFTGRDVAELIAAHTFRQVVPPSALRPEVPADLDAIVLRCLAKKPGERFATSAELGRALDECSCASDWTVPLAEAWWQQHISGSRDAANAAPR
jgi:serine/threonine-protein kinase